MIVTIFLWMKLKTTSRISHEAQHAREKSKLQKGRFQRFPLDAIRKKEFVAKCCDWHDVFSDVDSEQKSIKFTEWSRKKERTTYRGGWIVLTSSHSPDEKRLIFFECVSALNCRISDGLSSDGLVFFEICWTRKSCWNVTLFILIMSQT